MTWDASRVEGCSGWRVAGVRPIIGAGMLALGLVCAVPAWGVSWRRDILTADNLTEQAVKGAFSVLPDGGPDGEAVIEFADPVATSGSIEIDLSGIDLTQYDQLHFDLWLENDYVDTTVTLRGYPDAFHGRRWYAFKRFQPLEEWTDIRLDLDLDDDMSRETFDDAQQNLVMVFRRPDTVSPDIGRARIHNVRLVRSPVRVRVDYKQSTTRIDEDGLRFTYPVEIENTTDRALDARLDVLPETLKRFAATLADEDVTLPAGERVVTTVELAIGADVADLPTGYVERAQVRVSVPELPGFTAVPIRGYRPVYLFALVPPSTARDVIFQRLQAEAQRLSDDVARYEGNLNVEIETPPSNIAPAHPAGFRCPECRTWLRVVGLYTYSCPNRECAKFQEQVTLDKDDPPWLFRPLLHNWHTRNAGIARNLALGWLRTGDERLGRRALEILLQYEGFIHDLPRKAPHSVAFQSRVHGASLFDRHFLEHMVETWLILSETGIGDAEQLRAIADGLLADSLHITNQHFYSFSASQIDLVTQVLKASAILGKWAYAADALAGDSGVQLVLNRNFNADGVSVEGGDYATQASRQIMTLAASLRAMDIAVEEERMQQIAYNSRLLGYLARPDDFEMRTTVLENTGFTILVNGDGPTRRRATINWGSTRERGAHDHLTTVLHDAEDRELLLRTRRVMWGHPHAFIAFQSFAQNIPVVDERNISTARLNQEYLRDDARAAGVIISDYPERPAYPESRLTRSLVLFDGCLLVVDRFVSLTGERQVDFPLNGLAKLTERPDGMAPFEGELGQTPIYRLPQELHAKTVDTQPFTAQWADGNRGVKLHALGDGFQVFAGKSRMGYGAQSVPRDFLMLRASGEAVTAAFLYEAIHGDGPKVATVTRAPVVDASDGTAGDDRALAYDVTFDDERTVRVLISLDGGAYRSGDCATDAGTRIAVHELD